ncbi:MAG TPA: hypothetical protein PKJ98_18495 [Verrucomicrobiota bacterium]|nr:hypothetical protein [Verrucomicrobiota bacterium]
MSTIPSHSRLADVSNAALFREVTADNFAILAEEIGLRLASYQNGSPTTIIGPPTAGTSAQSPRLMEGVVTSRASVPPVPSLPSFRRGLYSGEAQDGRWGGTPGSSRT